MKIALLEPDIPQNTGTILRTAACVGVGVDVIEPCGFVYSDRHLRRAGMDYVDMNQVVRHVDWAAFRALRQVRERRRVVLLSTEGAEVYTDFAFRPDDVLLAGRESAGAPPAVHAAADACITIPMVAGMRSLNVAVSVAMVLGEALRQCPRGS